MSVFSTTLSYGFPHGLAKTARPLAFAIASLCLNAFSFGQNTIFITSPANGSNADHNTDLSVNVSYQTGGGGYQTPTWAYKIDSSFPTSYQSAHGGIQVTGQTTVNDFLVGQANGMRNVHVALLDQAGNLLNPTATASVQVNYQSGGGNYQSGGDNYQSGSSGNQSQGGGDQILVLSPGNGTHVDPHNDNILVGVNFATGGGSYQTPTWAYKIDSPFPATYQSSHGGTLVYGHFEGNFMNNSQSFGQHTLYVTMLEQNGNLKNPPLGTQVSFNYQSGSGGYQSGAGGNQAQGGGDQIFIVSPGNGTAVDQHNDGLLVNVAYASAGGGYQTPKWAYKIDSPFPTSYQSSHGGTVVDGHYKPNFMNDAQNFGQHTVYVTLLEQNGNLRNPPLGAHVSFNYQSQQVDYQSGHNNYQSGQGNNQQIGFFDFTVRGNVDLNSSAALKALAANHQWIYFQVYMDDQNVSYDSAGEKVGNSIWALSIENATGGQPNMIVDMSGKVYHGDFASYWFRAHGIDTSNNSHWREMSYSTTSAGIDSLLMAHPVIHDPTALLHTIKPFDFMPDGQANLSSQSALLQLASGHAEIYFQKYHFPETTSAGTHSANQDAFLNPLEIISGQERYQSQAGDYQPGGGNYQSGGGNYQSGGGNYQSGGGGFVPYTGPYVSPTHDLRLDTRNALFDDHVENKGLNSVTKLKADYNTTKAFNDSIDALLVTLPTLAPPPSTAKGDAIDNWIKGEFEQVKTLDPKKETAFVWALSIEDSNSAGNIVIDMHGNLYNNTDYESYWLSVYGVPTHNDPNWSEVEYHMSSAGLAKLYQDHPFVDPNVVIESKYKMAVVETDDPQVHGSTLHLSGSLRDSNGTSIMQVGFLISSQGHPSVSDPNSQTISASNVNNLLTASYVVPSGGVYYVRTFAQTMAGYSEGPVRKVEVFLDDLSSSDPKVVALAMIREGTVELAGGWRQSSWFGLYLDHGNGWIYHQVHGWLYMIHDGQNGIWTWQQQRKWVWTSRELYPYLYQADTASWLYLLGIVNGQAVFFNYGSYQIEIR